MNLTSYRLGYKKSCVVLQSEFNVTVGFPAHSFYLNHRLLCVANAILTVFIVLINSATVFTFWKSSRLKDRISHFLIMVQALCDTFVGLFNSTLYTYYLASEIRGNVNCDQVFASRIVSHVFLGFSLTSLLLINLERYIGILHPLAHRSQWSKTRILKSGLFHLVLWFASVAIRFNHATYAIGQALFNVHIGAYTTLIAFIYVRIYVVIIRKPFQVHTSISFSSKNSTAEPSPAVEIRLETKVPQAERRRHLKETKLVRSCFIVVACFFLCYLPVGLVGGLKVPGFLGDALLRWAITLAISNSLWNSLIFVWRDKVLRAEMKRVMSNYLSSDY